ncbi:MAG: hypothetical protein ACO311_06505 [Burkholderiaceae bacterium]
MPLRLLWRQPPHPPLRLQPGSGGPLPRTALRPPARPLRPGRAAHLASRVCGSCSAADAGGCDACPGAGPGSTGLPQCRAGGGRPAAACAHGARRPTAVDADGERLGWSLRVQHRLTRVARTVVDLADLPDGVPLAVSEVAAAISLRRALDPPAALRA